MVVVSVQAVCALRARGAFTIASSFVWADLHGVLVILQEILKIHVTCQKVDC